ncbi:MAG TPA: NAD-dependent epimerase/dehydratase family protein [Caldilineaceae bacterium]|nr:NAD-dependent epimerase/dehydratase family protein [Caldilineaceae bacterium]
MANGLHNTSIFVAGASGVVGRRLCRLLVADGWQVTGMTRSPEKAPMLRALGVAPVIVDIFDEERLHQAVAQAKPAVVIHQVTDLPPALDPAQMADALVRNARVRAIGTRHLVAAAVACGAKRMIAQSIAFAYAPGPLPYREEWPLKVDAPDDAGGLTARAVASLEQQVLNAPLVGIVLRYGRFYGPDTGFDEPPSGGPVHVDAAADAARRAVTRGSAGVYNIAEDDGTVSIQKATIELGWRPDFRMG